MPPRRHSSNLRRWYTQSNRLFDQVGFIVQFGFQTGQGRGPKTTLLVVMLKLVLQDGQYECVNIGQSVLERSRHESLRLVQPWLAKQDALVEDVRS